MESIHLLNQKIEQWLDCPFIEYCTVSSSVADPNPDPVRSGPFCRIRKVHHQIRIRIQLW
jgi:hypothetical protein